MDYHGRMPALRPLALRAPLHLRSRAAVAALAGLCALGPTRAGRAQDAATAPHDVAVPVGMPVTVDGRLDPGEWADAARLALPAGPATVWTKHLRGAWVFGVSLPERWPQRCSFRLYALPAPTPTGDGKGPGDAPFDALGAAVLDVEPNDHNRPHAFLQVRVAGPDGGRRWLRQDDRVLARFSGLRRAASAEVVVPLEVLGLDERAGRALRWVVAWSQPGRPPSLPTFPAGLDLSPAAPEVPSADLASTARWARTTFAQPSGPGFLPRTEWDALVAAEAELRVRGERAHRTHLELLGAFDEAPVEPFKVDAPLLAALDDLRWIALREPWNPSDGRAFATLLWKLNRPEEALATLRPLVADAPWTDHPETLRLAAMVAQGAEAFEEASAYWAALADAIPAEASASYRKAAATTLDIAGRYRATRAAREEDARRDDLPLVLLRTTKGDVTLRLLEDDCPGSVRQFVHLVETEKTEDGTPFYDGTRFHRVVGAGLVQGGDPSSRGPGCAYAGSGGSAWSIEGESNARHGFFRGAVGFAMALNRQARSQFFILTAPKPELVDDGFWVFATVADGMDVVDRLEQCDTLLSARVLRKRDHPYVPTKK